MTRYHWRTSTPDAEAADFFARDEPADRIDGPTSLDLHPDPPLSDGDGEAWGRAWEACQRAREAASDWAVAHERTERRWTSVLAELHGDQTTGDSPLYDVGLGGADRFRLACGGVVSFMTFAGPEVARAARAMDALGCGPHRVVPA